MLFPLQKLPPELGLEIIKHATTITGRALDTEERNQVYRNACALASVSTSIREFAMPHLLDTIILPSENEILLFLQAFEVQETFSQTGSRLKLDYGKYIRRFWCSDYQIRAHDDNSTNKVDYQQLLDILSRVQDVGFNFDSIHLLAEVLEFNSGSDRVWRPTRMMFSGWPVWNPLTHTSVGPAFLKGLTHLSIFDPVNPSASTAQSRNPIPNWVQRVPFKNMPNLRHFAFTLIDHRGIDDGSQIPIAVYSYRPSDPGQDEHGGLVIHQWITSESFKERIQKWITSKSYEFSDDHVCVYQNSGLNWFEDKDTQYYKALEAAFDRDITA